MDNILETEESVGDIHEFSGNDATIYTDGSGGIRSKDKRLRRCGWAWVFPKLGSHKEARFGARGALGGPQTVPRAELKAIHHCLSVIKHHKTIKKLHIVSDCKMAVDGLRKGRQYTSKTKLGTLWCSLWDEYESCTKRGIEITFAKVKSHSKEEHQVSIVMKQGNDVADHHAGLGVRECPAGEANRIRNLDSKVWWIQERMVQALLLLPKRGRHPQERQHLNEAAEIKIPHNRQRQAGARLLKHDVSRRGPMIECKRCGQFWESTATNLILAQGMCPEPKIYGQPQLERPWLIPSKRGPIWWGKHKLHKSHTAAWYRGVLYCSDCGHFSFKGNSLRGLALPC